MAKIDFTGISHATIFGQLLPSWQIREHPWKALKQKTCAHRKVIVSPSPLCIRCNFQNMKMPLLHSVADSEAPPKPTTKTFIVIASTAPQTHFFPSRTSEIFPIMCMLPSATSKTFCSSLKIPWFLVNIFIQRFPQYGLLSCLLLQVIIKSTAIPNRPENVLSNEWQPRKAVSNSPSRLNILFSNWL